MKKFLYTVLLILSVAVTFESCSDTETYAEQRDRERQSINTFIVANKINVISETQFLKDTVTDVSKNQYVLFENTGVYMQIRRMGTGEKLERGKTARVICRFIEFNILGDSIQLRSDVNIWHPKPDIMKISNNSGSFTANFDTEINGGGAMYLRYGSTSVPSGWLVPFSYINIGRQDSPEEGIAKVRLIVPHSEGQVNATSNVYPCFYELTFQKMRD